MLVGALKLLSSVIVGGLKPQEVTLWGDSPARLPPGLQRPQPGAVGGYHMSEKG